MDQQQPEAPAYQPPANQTAPVAQKKNGRKTLALWLLIAPTALIIGSIMLYAVVNFILASVNAEGPSVLSSILNVILFLIGTISVITWLPGLIAGIILLATEKKK